QSDRGALAAASRPRATNPQQANERLDLVEQMLRLFDEQLEVRLIEKIDFRGSCNRAQRGAVLQGDELRPLGQMLWTATQLRDAAEQWPTGLAGLQALLADMPNLRSLALDLLDAFDEEGELVDDASAELARLRGEVRRRAKGLRSRIEAMMRDSDDQGLLQDEYWTVREGRYVLPVRASDKRELSGIIHGSSQTGQTVYIEPTELVEANNTLAMKSEAVKREELRILRAFSAEVGRDADNIDRTSERLADVDVIYAAAKLAQRLDAARPSFGATLSLRRARHPLLVLDEVPVIANDLILEPPATWMILSGPNGGGKTVALTTSALAVEMAAHGLYICASSQSEVPWVRRTLCVLGDAQDLDAGLSTFAGHLQHLKSAHEQALAPNDDSATPIFVLLDEVASGTDPSAGAALARALLEEFAKQSCLGLATTHYEAVKTLAFTDPRFANAALKLERQRPTYRIEVGVVGASSPLALASRMGLHEDIIDRAAALMGSGGKEMEQALRALRDQHAALQRQLSEATKAKRLATEARDRLERQRAVEKKAAERRINRIAAEAVDLLETAIEDAKKVRKGLDTGQLSGQDIARQSRKLAGALKQARELKAKSSPSGRNDSTRAALDIEHLSAGAIVWHVGLKREVTVTDVKVSRSEVRVSAGGLELRCGVSDLRVVPTRKPRSKATKPVYQRPIDDDDTHGFATCDLRGMRVDEALAVLDKRLDEAIVQSERGLMVVHGHGTGALKHAIQEHLPNHIQVARHRFARSESGGDGATVVWLVD
ncbi:MAG TPA: hypothetical protein DCQ06_02180, partial [Myxococcales bacterium]|nr:hypothetical protein [Myxococcales bacterium]